MTWLVWRQHRYEILAFLVVCLAAFASLVYGADYATRVRSELGVDTCQPLPNTNANCVSLSVEAGERVQAFRWLVIGLFFLPALIGSFVGGPLFARDLERGTHRLAWTQATTRTRWAATKLLILLAAVGIGAALIAAVGGRATQASGSSPVDAFQNFELEGPAFVAHAVFAVALAAFIGAWSRRILTGMFVGLLVFLGVWVGVMLLIRPMYEPPVTVVYREGAPAPESQVVPSSWVIAREYIDHDGDVVPQARVNALMQSYRPTPFTPYDPTAYLAQNDARQRVRFQPPDRYWLFQWTEGLLFLTLAGGCAAGSLLLLRGRDA